MIRPRERQERKYEEMRELLEDLFTQIEEIREEFLSAIDDLEDPSEKKYEARQTQAKPLIDAYFAWLHTLEVDVDRSLKIGDAILYTLNQEKYLRRYLEDGHLSIDNNDCERSIKNFAVGRRNWLFAKSIKGAEASAVIYSIT